VIHRGVQYTVVATAEPDIWEWRYEYGNSVKTGKTQTRLAALAARRVKSKIDAALRAAPPESDAAAGPRERPEASAGVSQRLT
jgi:hypothetical protein